MGLSAQQPNTHHLLDTGDKVPDYTLPIGNYPSPTVTLSDLQGKLVILDFWGVSCSPCIAAMPKMQALQEEFGDRIQIILVTSDSREQVERMKQRSSILREVSLPSIIGDSLLLPLFPIRTFPAHVWIGPDGIVRHITNGKNTTAALIASFLDNRAVDLPAKFELKDLDQDVPIWLEGNGRHVDKLQYYSLITSRIATDGGQYGAIYNPAIGMPDQVRAFNKEILTLFKLAYGKSAIGPFKENNRVIIEVSEPDRIINPGGNSDYDWWKRDHTYCYELKVPEDEAAYLFDYMKQDLERYFKIKGAIEIRVKPALVLQRIGKTDRLRSKAGPAKFQKSAVLDEPVILQNQPINELIMVLEDLCAYLPERDRPVVDRSDIPFNIDIQLTNKALSLDEVRRSLRQYGLDLVPEDAELECLVLRDR